MRECVSRLTRLRNLAFSRNSYRIEPLDRHGRGMEHEKYYDLYLLPDKYWVGARDVRKRTWERIHRGMILSEAHQYMRLLPELEWVYFGQLPMRVIYSDQKRKKIVETLSRRDECLTYLTTLFSGGRV